MNTFTICAIIFVSVIGSTKAFGEDCSTDSAICTDENEECKDWLETKTCQCKEGFPVVVKGKCARAITMTRIPETKPGDDCTAKRKCTGQNQVCKEDGSNPDKKKKTCQCHPDYPLNLWGKCTQETVVEDKFETAAAKKSETPADEKSKAAAEEKTKTAAEEKSGTPADEKSKAAAKEKSKTTAEEKSKTEAEKKSKTVAKEKSKAAASEKSETAAEEKSKTDAKEKSEEKINISEFSLKDEF